MVSGISDELLERMCTRVPETSGCTKKKRNGTCPAKNGNCTSRYQHRHPQQR